jgi:hypothetical protein
MKLKKIERDDIIIPEFNGNKKLPESEQIKIKINRWPSVTEAKAYKNFSMETGGQVSVSFKDNVMIPSCVGRIENLVDGTGREIKNGSDLSVSTDTRLGDLVTELRDVILNSCEELEPGESKA